MNLDTTGSLHALTGMMFAAAGIETYLEIRAGHFPPRPFRFVGVALVYGLLGMLSHLSASLAGVLGLGMLIALIIKMPSSSAGAAPPQGGGGGGGGAAGGGTVSV